MEVDEILISFLQFKEIQYLILLYPQDILAFQLVLVAP